MSKKIHLDILVDSGNVGSTPIKVPMEQNLKLTQSTSTPLSDQSVYRRLVGHLLYLTISRLDICCSVQTLSQFMAQPTDMHLLATHKLLKYVKVVPSQGLLLSSSSFLQLATYCDSNWASCLDTRHSVTGYCIFLVSSLIS